MQRKNGRRFDEIRPINITYNVFEYADGSVLYSVGKTKVLCAVTLQHGVPHFLRGTQTGWLKAQYAMLPHSTHNRIEREINTARRNGRYMEISRLIGRSLRCAVNFEALGEKTIIVDCDVLQADGGTRTASISGAFLALKQACAVWQRKGLISSVSDVIKHNIAAVSVGLMHDTPVLDPDFIEDSSGIADVNFVLTDQHQIIEVQGSAEKEPVSWTTLTDMKTLACKGVSSIFDTADSVSSKNILAQKDVSLFEDRV